MTRLTVLLPAALVAASAAEAQSLLRTMTGTVADPLGKHIAYLGDVQGDGVADWLITTAGSPNTVRVHSGATGAELYPVAVPANATAAYAYAVHNIGDADGDSVPDFIVASGNLAAPGRVYAHSGATGALLYEINRPGSGFGNMTTGPEDLGNDLLGGWAAIGSTTTLSWEFFRANGATALTGTSALAHGMLVRGMGDLTGDGVPEFLFAGGPNVIPNPAVVIRDGASGGVLAQVSRSGFSGGWGASVCNAGDVDRDGIRDFVIGIVDPNAGLGPYGGVQVHSSSDGRLIYARSGNAQSPNFGYATVGLGDIDNDGHADFAVGNGYSGSQPNYVDVVSGRQGITLYHFTRSPSSDYFGREFARAGDVDGDGFGDLLISAAGTPGGGQVQVFSLVPQGIVFYGRGSDGCVGRHRLHANSVPRIGNAQFQVTCDRASGTTLGFVVLAQARRDPGSDYLGLGADLVVDLLAAPFLYTLVFADAAGHAAASLPIPNNAALVGQELHAQALWYWGSTCPNTRPTGFSSSNGATIRFQQ